MTTKKLIGIHDLNMRTHLVAPAHVTDITTTGGVVKWNDGENHLVVEIVLSSGERITCAGFGMDESSALVECAAHLGFADADIA